MKIGLQSETAPKTVAETLLERPVLPETAAALTQLITTTKQIWEAAAAARKRAQMVAAAARKKAQMSSKSSCQQQPAKKAMQKRSGTSQSHREDRVLPCGLTERQLTEMMSRELTPNDYELLLRLDEQVAKPTCRLCSSAQVKRFPTLAEAGVTVGPESQVECGVCLCPIEADEPGRQLPCCSRAQRAARSSRAW